ncbi:glycosyltransferase family A protein [Algoriphagus terrigena]|uniref:glycosyltransferase family A protein n=1 Tax=Algoriphagus terrigena TaxID=344884 RepID=UPI00040E7524|nr:glycosyltransferase family A protein [Algoriphagus terrigena]
MDCKFCVIVPVYNEGKFLERFLESIINQSKIPSLVVCVDDNSTDDSARIIKRYSEKFPYILYVFNESGSFKVQGTKVISAFNFGMTFLSIEDFYFISKIDADLELPFNYFQTVIDVFQYNSSIGITGGRIVELSNGSWTKTTQANYHVRGALKSYRVDCFKQIGGLLPVLGWDGLDEMTAMFFGWGTKVFDVDVKHFRPAASDYNYKELCFKLGVANYCNGSNLFLAFVRASVRSARKLNLFIFYYFLKGYLTAQVKKYPKNVSPELALFINRFHLKRIFDRSN